jgi:hypothetical protein
MKFQLRVLVSIYLRILLEQLGDVCSFNDYIARVYVNTMTVINSYNLGKHKTIRVSDV